MRAVLFFMNKEKNQKKHFLPALRAESSRQWEIFRCLLLSHLLHLAKMIFSLLNILASTNTPSSVTRKLTPTVIPTPTGSVEKENTPVMHCTQLYSGMQYAVSSWDAPPPNIPVMPSPIDSSITGMA